jgi:hypothetical protein
MTSIELIKTTIYFVLILTASVAIGSFVSKKNNLGLAIILGLSVLGNIGLILGLFSVFTKNILLIIILLSIYIFRKWLINNLRSFLKQSIEMIKLLKFDYLSIILLVTSSLIIGSLYLSSLQPPFTIDELAYHFPQANSIVNNQKIDFVFMGGNFYGNIPKLMEIIFAIGISIYNYSLAHATNFIFFIGFLLFVFDFIKRKYSLKAASWSIFLICLFDDFVWNATTGYIDAATSILEISSLLLILEWATFKLKKDKSLLILSGLLIGSSLAMKYSPLPTVLFMILIITISQSKKIIINLITFSFPALIMGGYWYVKNIIIHQNPFYPLYFSHKGMTEIEYNSLINAIQQFQPKTFSTFLNIINHFKTFNGISIYLSFFIFPFTYIFDKKNRKLTGFLTLFSILYLIYWFFFATHQIRFLTTGILISTILVAILLSLIKTRIIIISVLVLIFVNTFTKTIPIKTVWHNYWYTKLNVVRRQYALGNETTEQFYTQYFGCKYSISNYLSNINYNGKVIDNWTVWLDRPWPLLPNRSLFITFEKDVNDKDTILKSLISSNIDYLYLNEKIKAKHFTNQNPLISKSRDNKIPAETLILKYSNIVYSKEDCKLYKIDRQKLEKFLTQ